MLFLSVQGLEVGVAHSSSILAAYLATYSPLQHFQLPTAIRLGEAAAGGHEATEVRVREEGMERRQFRGERRPGNAVLL